MNTTTTADMSAYAYEAHAEALAAAAVATNANAAAAAYRGTCPAEAYALDEAAAEAAAIAEFLAAEADARYAAESLTVDPYGYVYYSDGYGDN